MQGNGCRDGAFEREEAWMKDLRGLRSNGVRGGRWRVAAEEPCRGRKTREMPGARGI